MEPLGTARQALGRLQMGSRLLDPRSALGGLDEVLALAQEPTAAPLARMSRRILEVRPDCDAALEQAQSFHHGLEATPLARVYWDTPVTPPVTYVSSAFQAVVGV